MQEMNVFWLRVAAGCYSAGLLHAILTILKKHTRFLKPAVAAFVPGVIFHFVAIVELWFAVGHVPEDNFFETVSLCAFLFALSFLFVYWRYQFSAPSIFVFPLIFLMTLVGATEIPVRGWTDSRVRDAWLLLHVVLILVAYAAILLTASASVVYLIQERQLKTKRPSGFFDRLPPLGTLDSLLNTSMGFGFVFMTLAVVAGSSWAFVESGTRWIGDGKIVISLVTWAFYLAMIYLRAAAGWRGRKAALLSLSLLVFCAATWAAHVGLLPAMKQ